MSLRTLATTIRHVGRPVAPLKIAYCPTCQQETLPKAGRCLWCETRTVAARKHGS